MWEVPVKLICELSSVRAGLDLPGLSASGSPADRLDLLICLMKTSVLLCGCF